jgi:hypothetical protein
MQRYELDTWLGDDHGLTEDQITELLAIADDIDVAYPDRDDQADAEQALVGAYRAMVEDPTDLATTLGSALFRARLAELEAKAALRGAAIALVGRGKMAEAEFARASGVTRMTVRSWLGK